MASSGESRSLRRITWTFSNSWRSTRYALDGGLDNGKAYADLFTDDGEFHQQPTPAYPTGRVWSGRKELLTIAAKQVETPNALGHFIMNHMIEPTAGGATGKEVLVHHLAARR